MNTRRAGLCLLLVAWLALAHVDAPAQRRRGRAGGRAPAASAKLTPREIVALVHPATVSIYVADGGGNVYAGSGFFVAPNVIATCFHVVEGAAAIIVTPVAQSNETHRARVLKYNEAADLALLAAPTLSRKPLRLFSGADLYAGEDVFTVGSPKGLDGTFTNGILSNFHELDTGVFLAQFTAAIAPGSSGGPLVNNRGEVIGVVTSRLINESGFNFAVMSSHLRTLTTGTEFKGYVDSDMGPPKRKP